MSNDISKYWISSLIKKCFDKRDSYSTTEHKVGTWIDGKPIYRKVLTFSGTGSAHRNQLCTYDFSEISEVTDLKGSINVYQGNSWHNIVQLGTYFAGCWTSINLSLDENIIWYYHPDSSDFHTPFKINIIIEYTKTTDN